MQEVATNGFEEGVDFENLDITFLVNFNTFFVMKKVIFYLKNKF